MPLLEVQQGFQFLAHPLAVEILAFAAFGQEARQGNRLMDPLVRVFKGAHME